MYHRIEINGERVEGLDAERLPDGSVVLRAGREDHDRMTFPNERAAREAVAEEYGADPLRVWIAG